MATLTIDDKRHIARVIKQLGALNPAEAASLKERCKTTGVTRQEADGILRRARQASLPQGIDSWRSELKKGGYMSIPQIIGLVQFMPGPVLKGYLVAVLRSDSKTGTVTLAGSYLAKKIGATSRDHGKRVLARLVEAGLLIRLRKGVAGMPSLYRLVAAHKIDKERAERVLSQPLTSKRLKRTMEAA